MKNSNKRTPKKGLFETFYPDDSEDVKQKVIRKLNSLIIVDDFDSEKVKQF